MIRKPSDQLIFPVSFEQKVYQSGAFSFLRCINALFVDTKDKHGLPPVFYGYWNHKNGFPDLFYFSGIVTIENDIKLQITYLKAVDDYEVVRQTFSFIITLKRPLYENEVKINVFFCGNIEDGYDELSPLLRINLMDRIINIPEEFLGERKKDVNVRFLIEHPFIFHVINEILLSPNFDSDFHKEYHGGLVDSVNFLLN